MTISNTELRNSAAHILKCVHLIADLQERKDMTALAEAVLRLLDENERVRRLLVQAFEDTRSCTCLSEIEEKFRAG